MYEEVQISVVAGLRRELNVSDHVLRVERRNSALCHNFFPQLSSSIVKEE